MILEQNILPFSEWFFGTAAHWYWDGAALQWLMSAGILLAAALIIGLVVSVIQNGGRFWTPFVNGVRRGAQNLTAVSFARTWAIARLTMKESLRRRVLFLFALFMILLLVGGLFLDPNSEDPARLYMSFVMGAATVLIFLLSLFLSAFSLPTDIKNKTIYTVVTKPVRSSEMVFGRILGIAVIGTVVLVLMGTSSYFFVKNELQHTHLLGEKDDLTPVSGEWRIAGVERKNINEVTELAQKGDANTPLFRGETRTTNGHKHPVTVYADGKVSCGSVNGHTHEITSEKAGSQTKYIVHESQGMMQARIPVYGKLRFRGTDGNDKDKGINVGDEWEYRSFIGGTSKTSDSTTEEAAVFSFSGLNEAMFPKEVFSDGLPVEMTLGVFRTHKGNIEKRVTGSLALRNPKTGLKVEVKTFSTEEFITKAETIPWTFEGTPQIEQQKGRTPEGEFYVFPDDATVTKERTDAQFTQRRTFDLFKDFVADGKVEVWLQCIDSMQYIGVAQTDLYLRADDADVPLNFVKGYFGIWMQMIIVISFGVLFSTFLSGPVAMISTVGVLVAGFSKAFMMEIGLHKVLGGGPFEALYRLLIQQNMVVDLPNSFAVSFIKASDSVFGLFLTLMGQAIPSLSPYSEYTQAVAKGFDVPGNWLANHSVMTLAYAVPVFIVAYLILSNREIAKA
ncbi:MAG: hypothetical protein LBN39_06265 [Planctomycetaceae bacterium]|jgi:hypothetical protein|nr:hypothetical protein [Planctomycetaceae bacterium]